MLSFGQTQNDEEAMPMDITKIPKITDMLTSKQVKQDLLQSYKASSESIKSASCILSKQLQVNVSKLAYSSCDMKELKSDQYDKSYCQVR
ncbi:hypothetical protein C1645_815268 [Glomus cerebriforme]|uniref:Uncharacterized protein n=1 Tax=Glomus cerebriforme TaxID=658196 RepID=A0A397TGU2_9GLOM|nr:hypothetical protein C1645_815268 [Glomus cerebriforme]